MGGGGGQSARAVYWSQDESISGSPELGLFRYHRAVGSIVIVIHFDSRGLGNEIVTPMATHKIISLTRPAASLSPCTPYLSATLPLWHPTSLACDQVHVCSDFNITSHCHQEHCGMLALLYIHIMKTVNMNLSNSTVN